MLIGHGTRDEVGTQQFFQLGEKLAETVAPTPVESCLLEFQQPTIPEAWQSLVEKGVRQVHVAPLLLFAAGHAKQDIPDVLKQCREQTPGVSFDQSRPISRHPELVHLVTKRIQQTLSDGKIDATPRTALVMVGRGNRDPCAQADMRVLTEVVARRFAFGDALTAFYAMAQPALTDGLERVAASGRFDNIVIHPHLLFAGRLFEAIGKQVAAVREQYPRVRFQLGQYLGPEIEIARAIADRMGLQKRDRRVATMHG